MEFNKAYNRAEFLSFLRTSFLPEDFQQESSVINNPVQFQYTQQVTRLGECESLGLVVYEVRHSSKHDARVGLTKEAFRLLADEFCERALVFFVPKDDDSNYRFSLIEITLDQSEESSRISRRYSNPHRYSYFLGKGIAYYTPNKYLNEYGRVVSVEDLRNRFSVEVLTKAFYQELSDWYAWAIMIVRFPNDLKTLEDNQKYNSEAMIRLITRLIFVWFLKQRHLVPDEFFDEQYIASELIEGFTPHDIVDLFGKSYDSKYYKGILQNLFFAMLNSPITPEGKDTISERRFRNGRGDYDNNKLMRHEDLFINPDKFVELANKYVPFLNGGLFDCLDDKDKGIYIDAFTDRKVISDQLVIPDFLFFGDEVGKNIDLSEWYGDKKKKKVSARGIIDILKRYNFTVEENMPFDQEVSLDPELLGKVFENLLAAYNPETQTTARKQTGSFYTPREIVQYMVDESLVAHLKRTVGEDLKPEYRKLIQYTDEGPTLTDDQKRQIMQSLYECKVLDPACGSGAFPMGMLQQMVHILGQLDPNNEQWKDMMLNNAISETSEAYRNATDEERAEIVADIERSFNESINRPDYARKLYLIENCIYGVDIQPIAIQISKLRFFISLVVDQKTNNNPVDNFGIRPLPNLEAKFVAANTLVGLEKRETNLFDSETIREKEKEMKEAKHRIFGAKTVKTKRKYKDKVVELRTEIAKLLEESGTVGNVEAKQMAQWDMFDQNSSSPFYDSEWMFGINNDFDIIIGNPPYGAELSPEHKNYLKERYAYIVERIRNSYLYFMGIADTLSPKGIISYIVPNEFLFQIYMCKARRYFLENTNILQVINVGESAFDAVVPTCIFLLNHDKKESYNILLADIRDKDIIKDQNVLKEMSYGTMSNIQIYNNPLSTFTFDFVKTNLINKLLQSQHHFEDFCIDIFNGVSTSCNEVYIVDTDIIQHYDIEPIYTKPTIKGEHVVRYHLPEIPPLYLLYIKSDFRFDLAPKTADYLRQYKDFLIKKSVEKRKGNRPWYELFRSRNEGSLKLTPKIIIRQTGDSIIGALDEVGYYSIDSTNVILLKEEFYDEKEYLLAILNSKLTKFFYQEISQEGGRVLAQIKPIRVRCLPFPSASKDEKKKIALFAKEIMNAKNEDLSSEVNNVDDKIDSMVYHLYGLTYDEVLIVDPNPPFTREEYETARR